ncbi:FAD-binding protein [Elioraea sp.]|uniref:FAD-binding protein n=1 Tax=Elioraea sp. TaxID=2185103 RepID=UPI0025C64BD5|nr:FAD-binding protein [Elioraea sp.]
MSRASEFPAHGSTEVDVLVLGGGIAGHRAAVAARQAGRSVAIAYLAQGASPYIIGANVPLGAADPADGPAVFFDDIVRGGYGLNDRRLVEVLATQATVAFAELSALGVPFAREGDRVLQRHLSGNTYPRSVYVPEGTGRAILDKLRAHVSEIGVAVHAGWKALALLKDSDDVVGALLAKRHGSELLTIRARATVLAMGGIGQIYDDSTYPTDVASDAYALAFEAGASLIDMEFVQFEPVVTVWPDECRGLEMPTAMLGDGARLLNAEGERFMFRYNPEHGEKRLEKARLSLCIQREIDEGRGLSDGSVLFDTTSVPRDRLESYVSHCKRLRAAGLEPSIQGPHVRPAAHSQMGGVLIDDRGWSGVPGLYAGGEAAGGLHGASRLAGNGGSDTIVFGAVAGRGAADGLLDATSRDWRRIEATALAPLRRALGGTTSGVVPKSVKDRIRRIMPAAAGLYRDDGGLRTGLDELRSLQREIDGGLEASDLASAIAAGEAANMALVSRIVLRAALGREESRGAHQRRDFPSQDDARWTKHLAWHCGSGDEEVMSFVPVR